MLEASSIHQADLTVGDLCIAIGDGRLPAKLDDGDYYTVTRREIVRYLSDRAWSELTPLRQLRTK